MKIVITVSDFGAMMHTGADIQRESIVVEVPTPEFIKPYLENKQGTFGTISLSILKYKGE